MSAPRSFVFALCSLLAGQALAQEAPSAAVPAQAAPSSTDVAALMATVAAQEAETSAVPWTTRIAPRASALGIAPPPPEPARRTEFDIAPGDPAAEPARTIARRVAHFRNFRAEVPGATWSEDEAARFAIRGQANCLAELERVGVRAHLLERPLSTPVPSPVVLDAPIEGVVFASLHPDRDVEVSCELAARLPALARLLRGLGVQVVGVNSSYRDQPKVSFHTFGLALDLAAFRVHDRTLVVAKHFEVSPDTHTCAGTPQSDEGKELLAIVCAIAESHLFSSVLTPNYNEGHRDHVHLDLRPDDPRLFVR